jgi:6-phosphogluconate dehydrogenase
MELGMIGLGRMGANMVRRLLRAGHRCVVFDQSPDQVRRLVEAGAVGSASLDDFVKKLAKPRAAWMMVPSGDATEQTVTALAARMDAGDTVIDGGNSYFKDDVRRARALRPKGIDYLDVGTSGGVWGLERGYCLMIGGRRETVDRLDPIFKTLAPGRGHIPRTPGREKRHGTAEEGYLYCGPAGAGHFVKMVHNGIEYGVMQSYAEGFDILRGAGGQELPEERRYQLELADVAEVWRRGSVIGSWLLDLTAMALVENPTLSNFTGSVQDSGEGRWTVEAAIEEAVPAEVLTSALYTRFRSREEHAFAEKVLSAMRYKFGGHTERAAGG